MCIRLIIHIYSNQIVSLKPETYYIYNNLLYQNHDTCYTESSKLCTVYQSLWCPVHNTNTLMLAIHPSKNPFIHPLILCYDKLR